MTSFANSRSFQKLQTLKKNLIDLTDPAIFTPQRITQMSLRTPLFQLLYGAERVTEEILAELFALAKEMKVQEKMEAMQSGQILNQIEGFPSEKRAVLHTAMRDQFTSCQEAAPAKDAARRAGRELEKLSQFLKQTEGQFTDLVQIGIGGSDLGPRALTIALPFFYQPDRRAHFLSNIDPDDASEVFSKLDLKKTLVVVVSKSGTTLETLTNEELARVRFREAGLDPAKHFVAVTGENSPMDSPAHYLASFYIWDFVGGRYSATSMVGGVALSFVLGFQGFQEILRGAHAMDQHVLQALPEQNIALLSALLGIWNRNFLSLPTVAIIPYSQNLSRFPAHLQQLDMESNGKHIDKQGHICSFATGPVIWGEPGTNGQHSFYQLIHQGTDIVPIEFIGFQKSQYGKDLTVQHSSSQEKLLANLFAQSIALATGQNSKNPNQVFPGNRSNRILLAERLDPFTMGALLAFYEHKVAFQGFVWNINSFDQEGVQLGKILATKMLSLFSAPISNPSSFPLGAAYLSFLT